MKYKFFIPVFFVMLAFTACKNDTKNNTPETVEVDSADDITQNATKERSAKKEKVSFNDSKMEMVYRHYINLKDALVSTNTENASVAASELITAFNNAEAADTALKAAQNIVAANDIEEQRPAFVVVTTETENLLKDNVVSGTIYKQYCPMAFNNTGASWLSGSSDIMNPYFGDKMLRCGRIEAKIE